MCLPSLSGEMQAIPVSRPHDDTSEEEAGALVTASSAPLLGPLPARAAASQSSVFSTSLGDGAPKCGAERSRRLDRYIGCLGTDDRHAPPGRFARPGAVRLSDAAGLLANSLKINGRELG
jgi:hypothetical protein